jgi:putative transposase
VIRLIGDGHTRAEVAELCAISLSSVGRYLKRHRETGTVSPEKFGGHRRHALERHADRLRRWIALQPDLTLAEIRVRLAGMRVNVAISSICRFLNHSSRPPFIKRVRGDHPLVNGRGASLPHPVRRR